MSRRIAVMLGTLCVLLLTSPAQALADECALLDLDCVDDTVPNDPDEVLDDPVGTIVGVVDGAEDDVDPVVDPVRDIVDDVLNDGGGIVEPPIGDGPGTHTAGRGGGSRGQDPAGSERGTPSAGPTAGFRESFAPPRTVIGSAAAGTAPALPRRNPPGMLDGFVEGAVRGLLLLAVLLGITVGFVALQGRLDRNDPKLLAAPVRTEIVTFG
jgi:hypothetical protein